MAATPATPRGSRSKSGCRTCRGRKVKCDETRPACLMCTRLRLACVYAPGDAPAVRLHDRRVGAGSIKKRQHTGWQPQRIAAAPTPASTSASTSSSPTPTPPSLASPACLPPAPPLSAPFGSFSPDFFPTGLLAGAPASSTSMTVAPAQFDFAPSSYLQDGFVTAAAAAASSPSTYGLYLSSGLSPGMETDFMFLDSIPDMAMYTPEDSSSNVAAVATTVATASAASAAATAPAYYPLGLVLGTATIMLSSFDCHARLTERDYEALVHFHHHVGFSIGSKSPVWSTHAILIKLAVHHPAILHFLLAASFTEQHWRAGQCGHDGHVGLGAYASATSDRYDYKEAARAHYMAGEAALAEMTAAAQHGDGSGSSLYHVVVVACFWLEYLVHRRRASISSSKSELTPESKSAGSAVGGYRRWATSLDFSSAMGDHVHRYRLRGSLMGRPEDEDEDEDEDGDEDETPSAARDDKALQTQNLRRVHVPATLPPAKYRSFLSRLLSWLYWYDITACFFGKGGQLADQFQERRQAHRAHDHDHDHNQEREREQEQPHTRSLATAYKLDPFYETARTTLLDFWDDYTPEEIADDNQNWPALQLINETWVAVHRLNMLGSSAAAASSVVGIAQDVRHLRTRYATVFRLSSFTEERNTNHKNGAAPRSRLLAMADWAVCHHLALEIHLLRAGAPSTASASSSSAAAAAAAAAASAAAAIIRMAERAIRTVGPVELDRFQWLLFWAGTATDDAVYRRFVQTHLINADFRAALEAILARRDCATMSLAELRAVCRAATM